MPTKNNILFISRAYGENAGGMERLSYELISRFSGAQRIVNETKPRQSLFSARVRSVVFVLTVIPRALMQARHADVVHIGDPVLLIVAGVIKLFYDRQIFCTVHGLDVAYQNRIYQSYLRLFLPSVNHFIAISDYAKNLVEKKGIKQPVTVIPPGIIDSNYDESISRQDLEKVVKTNLEKKIIVATTGRLIQRKGHAWFIEHVFTQLPENIVYIIAGDGPQREAIKKTIAKNNLQDRVIMLGRISDADQKVVLNTCDAFIQPNIAVKNDHEGFGIAPLEAALCARQVFAANIDGIPSAIIDGKNGTLLLPEHPQAWIWALTEYVSHPSINLSAREYTKQQYNWDTVSEKYSIVFDTR
ncbi:MAG: glycosyltransferase family 4 protein [Candidatus Andersenbacteria bacterium]|nr:glycosyltransferase family 4 protein [Candidatus Andersenbacteria bacterium]